MIKFTGFEEFLNVIKDFTKEELKKTLFSLSNEGLEIKSIKELIINENDILFNILPDGTLTRVNLYIAEQINYPGEPLIPKYKYHIFKCNTITEMFNHGRKFRYKINNRIDGTFYYKYIDSYGNLIEEREKEKLNICKNCLKKYFSLINKPYYPKFADKYVKEFNLSEFHKKFKSFFSNQEINDLLQGDYIYSPNIYPKNWAEISKRIKEKRNYTCEKCGFTPSNQYEKKFLHTHHINGNKNNNKEDNLKVLCIKCHSEVDKYHTRLKNSSDYKEFIKLLHKYSSYN